MGAPKEDWNAELDNLTAVLDRQAARASLDQKRKDLKANQLVVEVITDDIRKMQENLAKIDAAGHDANRRNTVNTQQIK